MASFNRVVLYGNLTRDVDLKILKNGMKIGNLTLAINKRRKTNNGEWVADTSYVDVTLWGKVAVTASDYLSKGSPVIIKGRLKRDTWEKDGKTQSKLKVVGEKIVLVGK